MFVHGSGRNFSAECSFGPSVPVSGQDDRREAAAGEAGEANPTAEAELLIGRSHESPVQALKSH